MTLAAIAGQYNVFVPAPRYHSAGATWSDGPTAGKSIPLSQFYIATPASSEKDINKALDKGRHVLFTPGVYELGKTIVVKRANTVVLGLGMPTLVAQNGIVAMTVHPNRVGVTLAGLMFDAGPINSRVLTVPQTHAVKPDKWQDPANPTLLADVFFRIGGPALGRATTTLIVNNSGVILDHIWAWRADHGNGVGWTDNTASTGVIVNGDHVTAYGLFVEHYQKYEVIWNGEYGRTIMFQNEMPYDPPSQADWQHDGVLGYAAYKVADTVDHHEAWGMGSYSFFNVGPDIHASRAFEAPVKSDVKLHDLLTVYLNGNGGIDHVVNDTGAAVNSGNQLSTVVDYP